MTDAGLWRADQDERILALIVAPQRIHRLDACPGIGSIHSFRFASKAWLPLGSAADSFITPLHPRSLHGRSTTAAPEHPFLLGIAEAMVTLRIRHCWLLEHIGFFLACSEIERL